MDTVRFTESHEWVKLDNDAIIIGISDHAVSQLSDLIHIELPEEGEDVTKSEPFGEIESVKTVAELISPVSGKILEVNTALLDDIEIIVNDPYENGWIIKVSTDSASEIESYMTGDEYKEYLKETDH